MPSPRVRIVTVLATTVVAAAAAIVPQVRWHPRDAAEPMTVAPPAVMAGAPPTSAEALRKRITTMENRLREQPHDTGAAVLLADALSRQARASGDMRSVGRAGELLTTVLKNSPGQYDALRLLGSVRLTEHRFKEALEIGRRARDLRPHDAWNYGIMGDALIELGRYGEAFAAIETMAKMRPGAPAYARVAYARELRGDLAGALQAMQMAAEATAPADAEGRAWYSVQIGELLLQLDRVDDAAREFSRAASIFPNYPAAMIGQGKVSVARGDRDGALAIYLDQLPRTPTLDLAARIGDLYAELGDAARSEHYYRLAEDVAGPSLAQTEAHLALFLAAHDRKLPAAVQIAEAVAATRDDVFTNDALAWAYYKAGRIEEARAASRKAMRTGVRNAAILAHAAAIERAAVPVHTVSAVFTR